MCGRCEWQSNPRPYLPMQEESKFRLWISQEAKMTFINLQFNEQKERNFQLK